MSAVRNAVSILGGSLRDPSLLVQFYRSVRNRLRSDATAYGLKRDLDAAHVPPQALIPIDVRPIRDGDVDDVLGPKDSLSPEEKWDRNHRRRLLDAGVGTCYVAVTADDVPCYVQWMFSSADNDFLRDHFHGIFPRLDDDTALLEGAYTPTAFRGQRIMSAAMSLIAERGRCVGARYVVTFVGTDNAASLKGCNRAGFRTYVERRVRWRLLRPSITFPPASAEPSLTP